MSERPLKAPEGWEHVLVAAEHMDAVITDVFNLPEAAEERAMAERKKSPEDHGDDLVCGCWAAALQASALLQLLGRHLDASLVLVREHAGFATPISTIARSVIEQGLRIAWLLGDDDVHNRERRFYEFEKEERRLDEAIGRISNEDRLEWEVGLEASLAELPGEPQGSVPSVEKLCEAYGESGALYLAYRMFSQPIHGTAAGANSFHVETRKALSELGFGSSEWIDAEFVSFPLAAMWEATSIAMTRFRDLHAPKYECDSLTKKRDFLDEISQVPPNAGWVDSENAQASASVISMPAKPNREQRRRAEKLRRQSKE